MSSMGTLHSKLHQNHPNNQQQRRQFIHWTLILLKAKLKITTAW